MSPLTPWPLVACSIIFQLLFCGGMLTLATCQELPLLPALKSDHTSLKELENRSNIKCYPHSLLNRKFVLNIWLNRITRKLCSNWYDTWFSFRFKISLNSPLTAYIPSADQRVVICFEPASLSKISSCPMLEPYMWYQSLIQLPLLNSSKVGDWRQAVCPTSPKLASMYM